MTAPGRSGVSMQPSLEGSVLPLAELRDQAQRALINLLDRRPGKKVLVLDPKVSGPLALVANISVLKEHGVDKLFHLEPGLLTDATEIVYLVRPTIQNMKLISEHVIEAERHAKLSKPNFSLFFTPRKTVICEKILEDEGALGSIQVDEYPLWMIPFEEDVLSLELENAFHEIHVESDFSALYDIANAIMQLQTVCGVIPSVKGKGNNAKVISNMLKRMSFESDLIALSPSTSQIDALVLLDRNVDLVSPMCTQLTYEGLIDEILGINNGLVEVPQSQTAQQGGESKPAKGRKIPLNSSDGLFRELRDVNFASVGPKLRNKTMHMREEYKEINQRTFSEVHQFVKKLNIMPVLDRHTEIASLIQESTASNGAFITRLRCEQDILDGQGIGSACEYAEQLMYQEKADIKSILRLLALISLVNGGIPRKYYDPLRWGILHMYGYEYLFTLNQMESAGLLKNLEGGRNPYVQVKKALRLVVEDTDDSEPNDISYVYSGYAPLSCRIVDAALRPGGFHSSGAVDEALKLIPGPHFDTVQETSKNKSMPQALQVENDGSRRTILVVFIGGVTFAEISALRFMGSQSDLDCNFIIMTTKLVNGTTLLSPFCKQINHE